LSNQEHQIWKLVSTWYETNIKSISNGRCFVIHGLL